MNLIQVILLIVFLLIMPYIAGLSLIRNSNCKIMPLVYGYIIQWALLFVLAVPLIIRGKPLTILVYFWLSAVSLWSVISLAVFIARKQNRWTVYLSNRTRLDASSKIYVITFILLVIFILYKTLFYVCADGDDAFYISVAQSANISDSMYLCDPYLGDVLDISNLPYRYALAPFPMWLAVLARISGLNVATVAHVIIPPVLILITFVLYYEIGENLFDGNKEKIWLYMNFMAVWVLFSNVSTSTAETFLLTRSRQGKEALANIIIPFAFLLCYKILELKEESNKRRQLFLGLFITTFAAALTSVFGNVLLPIMYGALLIYFLYKRNTINCLYSVACCIPNLCIFALYFMLD